MSNYNRYIAAGNLTRDPDLKYTTDGTAVCNFDLAVNSFYTDKAGEQKKDAVFIPCTVWKKQAETVVQYMKKGSPVLIEGRLKQESWEKDGQKRSKLVCVCSMVRFLNPKPSSQTEPPTEQEENDPNIPF